MTKKHYEVIAWVISDQNIRSDQKKRIAEMLANVFERDNPKFNRDKFLQACGINDES